MDMLSLERIRRSAIFEKQQKKHMLGRSYKSGKQCRKNSEEIWKNRIQNYDEIYWRSRLNSN